jgi:hypothetical protein
MNGALGNIGRTVFYSDPLEATLPDDHRTQTDSLRELVADIDAGKVETLIIIGGNPVYNTPIDLRLDLNRSEQSEAARAPESLQQRNVGHLSVAHSDGALPRVMERHADE